MRSVASCLNMVRDAQICLQPPLCQEFSKVLKYLKLYIQWNLQMWNAGVSRALRFLKFSTPFLQRLIHSCSTSVYGIVDHMIWSFNTQYMYTEVYTRVTLYMYSTFITSYFCSWLLCPLKTFSWKCTYMSCPSASHVKRFKMSLWKTCTL